MAFLDEERIFEPRRVVGWALFTLSAGFVNAGAVMSCNNFVSHITGNVTNLAGAEAPLASHFILVIALFLAGAMLAMLINETLKARPKAAFAIPVVLSFLLLLSLSIAGKAGAFGVFGASTGMPPGAFTMMGLLAAAMGMVNASIATATNNQVRVTHLTGPVTDLAANIVRAVLDTGKGTRSELRWALLRFGKLVTFAIGAAIAMRLGPKLEYDVFVTAGLIMMVALGFTATPDATSTVRASGSEEGNVGLGDVVAEERESQARIALDEASASSVPQIRPIHAEDTTRNAAE